MPVELPDSYESIYQRAILQMAAGNSDEAIESMLRIVNRLRRLRPETLQRKSNLLQTFIGAWNSAVEFLRWEKRYEQAIATTESVLNHLPNPANGWRRIASLMIEKGEVEKGLTRLRQIAEQDQDFESWVDLGAECRVLERYGEAEACYQSALSLAGSNDEAVVANVALFRIYQETDRVEQALDAWSMAAVLNPDLADQVIQVYAWLIRRGDLDRAREYLERERNLIRYTFYEGLLDWQAGSQETAREKWQDVLAMEVHKQDTDIETWMEAALRLDEPTEVSTLAKELSVDNYLVSVRAATLTGIAYVMLDEIDEAKEQFDQVILRLQRAWPPRTKIHADQWALLTSLVFDEKALQNVADYFDTDKGGTFQ